MSQQPPENSGFAPSGLAHGPVTHPSGLFFARLLRSERAASFRDLREGGPRKTRNRLENPIQPSVRDLCELYANVLIDIEEYQGMGGGILQILGRQRRNVTNRFQDASYFINEHHAHRVSEDLPTNLVGPRTWRQQVRRGSIRKSPEDAPDQRAHNLPVFADACLA
jgi:hypothetical protein